MPPLASLPRDTIPSPQPTLNALAMDLLTPAHLLICRLTKSFWSHLSWQVSGGVVAVTASEGAGPL